MLNAVGRCKSQNQLRVRDWRRYWPGVILDEYSHGGSRNWNRGWIAMFAHSNLDLSLMTRCDLVHKEWPPQVSTVPSLTFDSMPTLGDLPQNILKTGPSPTDIDKGNYSAALFLLWPSIWVALLCLPMSCNGLNFLTVPCPAHSQPSAEFPAIPQPPGHPRRCLARCPAVSPSASPSLFRLMTCCWAHSWMELLHRRR